MFPINGVTNKWWRRPPRVPARLGFARYEGHERFPARWLPVMGLAV